MHLVLQAYGDRQRHTAYDASMIVSGDFHSKRRESTRLAVRGLLAIDGELPNRAPAGRDRVAAYVITDLGVETLQILDALDE